MSDGEEKNVGRYFPISRKDRDDHDKRVNKLRAKMEMDYAKSMKEHENPYWDKK